MDVRTMARGGLQGRPRISGAAPSPLAAAAMAATLPAMPSPQSDPGAACGADAAAHEGCSRGMWAVIEEQLEDELDYYHATLEHMELRVEMEAKVLLRRSGRGGGAEGVPAPAMSPAGWQGEMAARASALWRLAAGSGAPAADADCGSLWEALKDHEVAGVSASQLETLVPGRRMPAGVLYQPGGPGAGPACAVVYIPGEGGVGGSAAAETALLASYLVPLQVAVVGIDASSSRGGAAEPEGVQGVVALLRSTAWRPGGAEGVALWGRSSGAATALQCAEQDPSLAALVCDGVYRDFLSLLGLPQWAAPPLYAARHLGSALAGRVACQGGLGASVDDGEESLTATGSLAQSLSSSSGSSALSGSASTACATLTGSGPRSIEEPPLSTAARCFVPALFVHGAEDVLVPPSHAEAFRSAYGGERQVLIVPGGTHESERPHATMARAVLFLTRAFRREADSDTLAALAAEAAAAQARLSRGPRAPWAPCSPEAAGSLLCSPAPSDRRRGLLLAALRACPSHRGAAFAPAGVQGRPAARAGAPLLVGTAVARLPSAESEVAVAMAWDAEERGAGLVHLVVISASAVSVTEVRLAPGPRADGGQGEGGGPQPPAAVAARVEATVRTLGIKEVALPPGARAQQVRFAVLDSGSVELQVGQAHLVTEASADGMSMFGRGDVGVSVWRAVYRDGAEVAGGGAEPEIFLSEVVARHAAARSPRGVARHAGGGEAPAHPPQPGTLLSNCTFAAPAGSLSLSLSDAASSLLSTDSRLSAAPHATDARPEVQSMLPSPVSEHSEEPSWAGIPGGLPEAPTLPASRDAGSPPGAAGAAETWPCQRQSRAHLGGVTGNWATLPPRGGPQGL
ncbi:unnamed protein product [Prorocentrum cordatum]|uniref:Uncharacterized protein n=1 Tax=Prorocentrum cordatum TaxID=2364126 RepID=A0ABN9V1X4_9DINO|nr:unnamed protein product [Polarella glacialis]